MCAGVLHVPVDRAEAKLRYRSAAIAGARTPRPTDSRSSSTQPAYGVAPGQLAVLYDERRRRRLRLGVVRGA